MNQKYYFYGTTINPKITGLKDGSCQVLFSEKFSTNIDWINQFMRLNPGDKWMDLNKLNINSFDGELAFQLKRTAKLTDLILHGPFIYSCKIVSKRLKEIIENSRLEKQIFKKIYIVNSKGVRFKEEYFLMQTPLTNIENINFKQTFFYKIFHQASINFKSYHLFYFKDQNEYRNNFIGFSCAKITFIKEQSNDVLACPMGYLISEKLKKEIELNKITNVEIIPFVVENSGVHPFVDFKKIDDLLLYK